MSDQQLTNIAKNWFRPFNDHDLEALLTLYAEEAQHYSPKLKVRLPATNGFIKGKAALRNWWQDSFARIPSLKYEILRLVPSEDIIFMSYMRYADGDEPLHVGETLEVRDGLITSSRVYHS